MFDIRSDQQVALYKPPNTTSGFTSCGLSSSGRLLFCGSDDNSVHMWDTLKIQHSGIFIRVLLLVQNPDNNCFRGVKRTRKQDHITGCVTGRRSFNYMQLGPKCTCMGTLNPGFATKCCVLCLYVTFNSYL